MSEKLTETEEKELAEFDAKLRTTPAEMSIDDNGRHIELLCKQSEAVEEEEMAEFEAALGVEPQEAFDPSIKTLVSGSGTITRYRIVDGKKQIVDELRPIPFRKGVRGGKFLEPVVVDGVGRLLLTPEFQKRILAQEPEATAEAARFGIEAVVKFFRRFTPDRTKQAGNPDSQAVPQGPRAEAVSILQAEEANDIRHRRLVKTAAGLVTGSDSDRHELETALGVADPKIVLTSSEVEARHAQVRQNRETGVGFSGELDLPTETVGS